jgi:hypothetical protein
MEGVFHMTPTPCKAIVIIRSSNGQNIGSHLLEYELPQELDRAICAIEAWAGYHEIIRLTTVNLRGAN